MSDLQSFCTSVEPCQEILESPLLTKQLQYDTADIAFKNLSYSVSSKGLWNEPKEILHKISGRFVNSQLIALLGPSGAGKSALMDVLSGFKTTHITGTILMNGRPRELAKFRCVSCYITQDERLQHLLTLEENMRIAADLKLGKSKSKKEQLDVINEIMSSLGLIEQKNTITGQLSGGQKKRLSIGLELINNPTVMFLDEPTTGLDSSSCTKVLELLKKSALQGRTIICTIHQPTAKLFQTFDHVYVLSAGNCVYQGSTGKLVPFLESVGLPCPIYHNPADYIIELACGDYGNDKVETLKTAAENGNSARWFENHRTMLHQSRELAHMCSFAREERTTTDSGFTHQLSVLLRRELIKMKRDTALTHLRLIVNVCVAVALGAIFVDVGQEASRMYQNFNCLTVVMIHNVVAIALLTSITFPLEMSRLLKEHFNRWYSLKAYYVAITLLDLPITIISCLIFSAIVYVWTCQPMEFWRFAMFAAVNILSVIIGQSCGLILGAWFDVANAFFGTTIMVIALLMFCGNSIVKRDMPIVFRMGTHVSYFRYSLEGLVSAIYGNNRGVLNCNEAIYCHFRHPTKFMEVMDIPDRYWTDIIALFTIIIFLRVATYFVLKAKLRSLT